MLVDSLNCEFRCYGTEGLRGICCLSHPSDTDKRMPQSIMDADVMSPKVYVASAVTATPVDKLLPQSIGGADAMAPKVYVDSAVTTGTVVAAIS